MPAGNVVRPAKWSDVLDLYDDGQYSAIWGRFENHARKCVGVRWNGADPSLGYPTQGGYALWFVEPDFMTESVLQRLLSHAAEQGDDQARRAILVALAEATEEVCTERRARDAQKP